MANYNLTQTGDEVQAYIDSIPVIDVTGTLNGSAITFGSNPYSQIAANYAADCGTIVRLTVGTAVYLLRVTQYDGTNYTAAEMSGAHNVVATIGSSSASATIDAGIDATPTQGSNNLITSGGVWSAAQLGKDIDAVKSLSQKKERLLSWKEVMDGNMYTLANTFTANIEDSGNIIIGKGLSIFKNEAGTASLNLSIRFPYSADLYMSWWVADRGKTGNTGSTLSIMVLQTTQINASHVAGTITGRIRFNLPKTSGITITNVLNAINTNGYYEYPAANIAKNQTYVSDFTSNPYTSIAIRITDYRIIDGNYYWHYDVHIEGLYETSFCAFGVEQSMAWVAGQTLFVSNLICQSLPIDNSSAQIEQEKWSNIVNGVDFPKVAYNYNQNNEIIDQFDDVGNQLAINTSTLTSWKQPTAYFYHILKSEFTKAKTDVSVADPYSGNTLKIPAYRYTNGGNAITFYYNANNFHPFINIIPQTRMSGKKYTAQLWVDLSELNGNAICRAIGTAMIMIDLRMAFEGMRYNITPAGDGYKFYDSNVYAKVVKRIGNMICLRFYNVEQYGLKLALFSVSATAVTQLTIYNPTLIEGERVEIDVFHVYQSESQRLHPQWRGKSVMLLGDSQYNNYIVAYNLVSRLGVNIYDGHYGGHSMRYNDTTAVNPTSKSWFYQLTYRKLILSVNVDAYLLTCSTNDTPATGSELTAATLADVLANYPEYKDFDTAAETSKMTTFNSLTTAQRQAIFTYMPTYAAYIRQMYEAHPYAKFFICSLPITCTSRLTGTAVPDPANPSESIGEWKEGQSADVARAALMNGFISMRDKIKYLADWTNAQFIDLFREAGLTFDNFIYHCQDGTHWHIDISQNCADAIINEIG